MIALPSLVQLIDAIAPQIPVTSILASGAASSRIPMTCAGRAPVDAFTDLLAGLYQQSDTEPESGYSAQLEKDTPVAMSFQVSPDPSTIQAPPRPPLSFLWESDSWESEPTPGTATPPSPSDDPFAEAFVPDVAVRVTGRAEPAVSPIAPPQPESPPNGNPAAQGTVDSSVTLMPQPLAIPATGLTLAEPNPPAAPRVVAPFHLQESSFEGIAAVGASTHPTADPISRTAPAPVDPSPKPEPLAPAMPNLAVAAVKAPAESLSHAAELTVRPRFHAPSANGKARPSVANVVPAAESLPTLERPVAAAQTRSSLGAAIPTPSLPVELLPVEPPDGSAAPPASGNTVSLPVARRPIRAETQVPDRDWQAPSPSLASPSHLQASSSPKTPASPWTASIRTKPQAAAPPKAAPVGSLTPPVTPAASTVPFLPSAPVSAAPLPLPVDLVPSLPVEPSDSETEPPDSPAAPPLVTSTNPSRVPHPDPLRPPTAHPAFEPAPTAWRGAAEEVIQPAAVNQGQPAELAFSVRLVPATPAPISLPNHAREAQPSASAKPWRPFPAVPQAAAEEDPEGREAVRPIDTSSGRSTGQNQGRPPEPGTDDSRPAPDAERLRRTAAEHPPADEPASTPTARSAFTVTHQETPAAPGRTQRSEAEASPKPPDPPASPEPAASRNPAATRDLKLELNSGDRKVELHLVDRGGDVHVAVRTPDSRLAGELRENLPSLSSRLEQSGYHPEGWQTSAARHTESPSETDPSTGNSSHSTGQTWQDAREQQRNPERRPPEILEDQPQPKQQGKEFAWFMSSLR